MARPAKKESKYNVHVRRDGGHTYLFSHVQTVNPTTGKTSWQKVQWGTLDEDNVFHPFARYFTYEDRDLLQFPDYCDLSVAKTHLSFSLKASDNSLLQYQNKLYGDIWLLERIAEQQHVTEDLLSVFCNDTERVKKILAIAYYIISQSDSLDHIVRWQNIEKTPTEFKLTPSSITVLVQSIKDVHRLRFLERMTSRVDMSSNDFVAVDTSVNLPEFKAGLQTIAEVIYSRTTHIPVYYDVIQGYMPDSKGIEQLRRSIGTAGFLGITYMLNSGYFTSQNIGMLLKEKAPAIIAAKVSDPFIRDIIKKIKFEDGCVPYGMDIDVTRKIFYRQYQISPETISPTLKSYKKYVYLNLYFNPKARSYFVTQLRATIEYEKQYLERLLKGKEIVDKTVLTSECWYFDIEFCKNSGRVRSYTLNEKKVEEAKCEAGYFANLEVNLKLASMEADALYGLRDTQEKSFLLDRFNCSSEESLRGQGFILFVASILLSHLRRLWRERVKPDKSLCEKYPTEIDVLEEMRSIRYIENEGQITPFVKSQLELCRLLGITPLKGRVTE